MENTARAGYGLVTHRNYLYLILAGLISLTYLGLTFFAPPANPNTTFNLNGFQIFVLKLTILIPYSVTWFLAAYGLSTLKEFISLQEGKKNSIILLLNSFRISIIWVVLGIVLTALIGGLRPFYPTANFMSFFTILTNYLYTFPPLIGFFIMYKGVLKAKSSPEISSPKMGSAIFVTFIVLVISAIYAYLIFTNPNRQVSVNPGTPATYFLPDYLILFTLVIPAFVTWWLGIASAFIISDLIPHLTKPSLYNGLTKILYGIWSIIFTSIIIQALLSVGTTRLLALGLGVILLIIYVFILLQGLGFLLIALGSRDLQKSINL